MDFKEWYHTVLSYKNTNNYPDFPGLHMYGKFKSNYEFLYYSTIFELKQLHFIVKRKKRTF